MESEQIWRKVLVRAFAAAQSEQERNQIETFFLKGDLLVSDHRVLFCLFDRDTYLAFKPYFGQMVNDLKVILPNNDLSYSYVVAEDEMRKKMQKRMDKIKSMQELSSHPLPSVLTSQPLASNNDLPLFAAVSDQELFQAPADLSNGEPASDLTNQSLEHPIYAALVSDGLNNIPSAFEDSDLGLMDGLDGASSNSNKASLPANTVLNNASQNPVVSVNLAQNNVSQVQGELLQSDLVQVNATQSHRVFQSEIVQSQGAQNNGLNNTACEAESSSAGASVGEAPKETVSNTLTPAAGAVLPLDALHSEISQNPSHEQSEILAAIASVTPSASVSVAPVAFAASELAASVVTSSVAPVTASAAAVASSAVPFAPVTPAVAPTVISDSVITPSSTDKVHVVQVVPTQDVSDISSQVEATQSVPSQVSTSDAVTVSAPTMLQAQPAASVYAHALDTYGQYNKGLTNSLAGGDAHRDYYLQNYAQSTPQMEMYSNLPQSAVQNILPVQEQRSSSLGVVSFGETNLGEVGLSGANTIVPTPSLPKAAQSLVQDNAVTQAATQMASQSITPSATGTLECDLLQPQVIEPSESQQILKAASNSQSIIHTAVQSQMPQERDVVAYEAQGQVTSVQPLFAANQSQQRVLQSSIIQKEGAASEAAFATATQEQVVFNQAQVSAKQISATAQELTADPLQQSIQLMPQTTQTQQGGQLVQDYASAYQSGMSYMQFGLGFSQAFSGASVQVHQAAQSTKSVLDSQSTQSALATQAAQVAQSVQSDQSVQAEQAWLLSQSTQTAQSLSPASQGLQSRHDLQSSQAVPSTHNLQPIQAIQSEQRSAVNQVRDGHVWSTQSPLEQVSVLQMPRLPEQALYSWSPVATQNQPAPASAQSQTTQSSVQSQAALASAQRQSAPTSVQNQPMLSHGVPLGYSVSGTEHFGQMGQDGKLQGLPSSMAQFGEDRASIVYSEQGQLRSAQANVSTNAHAQANVSANVNAAPVLSRLDRTVDANHAAHGVADNNTAYGLAENNTAYGLAENNTAYGRSSFNQEGAETKASSSKQSTQKDDLAYATAHLSQMARSVGSRVIPISQYHGGTLGDYAANGRGEHYVAPQFSQPSKVTSKSQQNVQVKSSLLAQQHTQGMSSGASLHNVQGKLSDPARSAMFASSGVSLVQGSLMQDYAISTGAQGYLTSTVYTVGPSGVPSSLGTQGYGIGGAEGALRAANPNRGSNINAYPTSTVHTKRINDINANRASEINTTRATDINSNRAAGNVETWGASGGQGASGFQGGLGFQGASIAQSASRVQGTSGASGVLVTDAIVVEEANLGLSGVTTAKGSGVEGTLETVETVPAVQVGRATGALSKLQGASVELPAVQDKSQLQTTSQSNTYFKVKVHYPRAKDGSEIAGAPLNSELAKRMTEAENSAHKSIQEREEYDSGVNYATIRPERVPRRTFKDAKFIDVQDQKTQADENKQLYQQVAADLNLDKDPDGEVLKETELQHTPPLHQPNQLPLETEDCLVDPNLPFAEQIEHLQQIAVEMKGLVDLHYDNCAGCKEALQQAQTQRDRSSCQAELETQQKYLKNYQAKLEQCNIQLKWARKSLNEQQSKEIDEGKHNVTLAAMAQTRSGLNANQINGGMPLPNEELIEAGPTTEEQHTFKGQKVNPFKTFANFVPSLEASNLLHTVKLLAADPGNPMYNPLYIYGKSGLGKTHILNAIANEVQANFPDVHVVFSRAEDFILNYVLAVSGKGRKNHNSSGLPNGRIGFNEQFKRCEVIIIDDIQNFSKAKQSREAFFDIIAEFMERPDCQLILASDVSPKTLEKGGFQARLTSRFGSGVCCEMSMPGISARRTITAAKGIELGIKLSETLIDYIAFNIQTNVREIEGAVKTLNTQIYNYGFISFDEAKRQLAPFIPPDRLSVQNTTGLSIDDIKSRVAFEFKVTVQDLESASKKKSISYARAMAMLVAKTLMPISLSDLGREFNKDHSSVSEAIKRMIKRLDTDQSLNNSFSGIVLELRNFSRNDKKLIENKSEEEDKLDEEEYLLEEHHLE